MPEPSNKEIDRIRSELLNAQSSHGRWLSLIDKREILENKLEEVEQEIETLTLKLYRRQAAEPEAGQKIFEEIEIKKKLLNTLKDKRHDLDNLLDVLELNTEDFILGLENQLTAEILKEYPDQKHSYDLLILDSNSGKKQQKALETTIQVFERLEEHLQQALETRKDVKRRGILSYVFGPSPNWMITKQLHAAEALISAALTKLRELSATAGFDEILIKDYTESFDFLEELREHCKKRWGFRHIDTIITSGLSDLQKRLAAFRAHQKNINALNEGYRAKFKEWLYQR